MAECNHACGGRCCRAFPLNASPASFARAAQRARWIVDGECDDPDTYRWALDVVQIADMLIPLDDEGARYTCRHFDWTAGLCTIYAARPAMCRDYPYDMACETCGYIHPDEVRAREERASYLTQITPRLTATSSAA